MFKRNSDITETRPKLDDPADKQSTKIQLLFCICCRGDNTQADDKMTKQMTRQMTKYKQQITKSEYKSV